MRLWKKYDHVKYLNALKDFEIDPFQWMDRMSAGQLKKTWISFALGASSTRAMTERRRSSMAPEGSTG